MYVLSAAQMREADWLTIHGHGIAGLELMEHAAAAVEARLERDFPLALAGSIGILCGGGNNGGDGLVLARRLRARRIQVACWLLAPAARLRGDAAAALSALQAAGSAAREVAGETAWVAERAAVLGCGLLVDALFGTGLVRPLQGWLRAAVEDVNANYHGPVLAVDIPSGLSADGEGPADHPDAAVLRASATVTFATPKRGHYLSAHAGAVGALTVAPIGMPEAATAAVGAHLRLTTAADCRPFLARRARAAHKGLYGHVFVIGGSRGKSGAVALAAAAAMRMGAGLVTAAVPESVLPIVAASRPELMTAPLPETPEGTTDFNALTPGLLEPLLAPATVVALGPGLSQSPASSALARHLVSTAQVPVVLDADGLNAFAGRLAQLRLPRGVLTPHPGEMARLFGVTTVAVQARRLYYAEKLAASTGAVVVLKGQYSVVADANGAVFLNPTGNPGMATGGAGDVLTGLIAGLLAQHPLPGSVPLELVAAAVYLHGRAGDAAAARLGEMSLLAGDITEALPAAIAEARHR